MATKKTVSAYIGTGSDKRKAGDDREIMVPDSLEEAKTLEGWGEKATLELAIRSRVIDVQRAIRTGDEETKALRKTQAENNALLEAKARADATLYDSLVAVGYKFTFPRPEEKKQDETSKEAPKKGRK